MPTRLGGCLALLLALPLTACTADSDPPMPAETVTVTATPEPPPPLVVEGDGGEGCTSLKPTFSDLGVFDYTWRANTDLTITEVEALGASGIRLMKTFTVPPVNPGGEIPFSGAIDWSDRTPLQESRWIEWSQRELIGLAVATAGQTGLFVSHVRFVGDNAEFGKFRVTYETEAGERGFVDVGENNTYLRPGKC